MNGSINLLWIEHVALCVHLAGFVIL